MFSLGANTEAIAQDVTISPVAAAEIAMEYASLSVPRACPRGVYITPSIENLSNWSGVFFVHSGPYANAVLRFTLAFEVDFPNSAPVIRFESEVFHPLIDPKSKVWHPRGSLSKWQPRIHHIPHLLHDLKRSFNTTTLDSIQESEAVNKQIWSLYRYSRHTFISMTAQRTLSTTSARALYPTTPDDPSSGKPAMPPSPTTPRKANAHNRQMSITSSLQSKPSIGSIREGPVHRDILFRKLEEGEKVAFLAKLRRGSLDTK